VLLASDALECEESVLFSAVSANLPACALNGPLFWLSLVQLVDWSEAEAKRAKTCESIDFALFGASALLFNAVSISAAAEAAEDLIPLIRFRFISMDFLSTVVIRCA
jgi:hypothetical protein